MSGKKRAAAIDRPGGTQQTRISTVLGHGQTSRQTFPRPWAKPNPSVFPFPSPFAQEATSRHEICPRKIKAIKRWGVEEA
jgi:hypothetical protein